jgi:hypothetical protein
MPVCAAEKFERTDGLLLVGTAFENDPAVDVEDAAGPHDLECAIVVTIGSADAAVLGRHHSDLPRTD